MMRDSLFLKTRILFFVQKFLFLPFSNNWYKKNELYLFLQFVLLILFLSLWKGQNKNQSLEALFTLLFPNYYALWCVFLKDAWRNLTENFKIAELGNPDLWLYVYEKHLFKHVNIFPIPIFWQHNIIFKQHYTCRDNTLFAIMCIANSCCI